MPEALAGILNVNKPARLSSAALVGRVKRLLPRGTKVGHAGTLDPFATGVLLILVGAATRRFDELMSTPKQYDATIKFGSTTATDDPTVPQVPWPHAIVSAVNEEQLRAALASFVGQIEQMPPNYSALKIGGRRAYQIARQGQTPDLRPRRVDVYQIELLNYTWPLARLSIDCGRGTYVRAIARDLGAVLNVGGHLTALCRTRVGPYSLSQAVSLEQLQSDGVARHLQ